MLPAFSESPANSARLTGLSPLPSKPVRPQVPNYFTILERCFKNALSAHALLHGSLYLAVSGLLGDLAPLIVLLLAASDGER